MFMLYSKNQAIRHFNSKIPFFISFLLVIYIVAIAIFGILRLVLLLYSVDESKNIFNYNTLKSLFIGIQYDSVVLAYVLILPLILLFIKTLLINHKKYLTKFVTVYLCAVFPLVV